MAATLSSIEACNPQPNQQQIARGFVEALSRGDTEGATSFFAPDIRATQVNQQNLLRLAQQLAGCSIDTIVVRESQLGSLANITFKTPCGEGTSFGQKTRLISVSVGLERANERYYVNPLVVLPKLAEHVVEPVPTIPPDLKVELGNIERAVVKIEGGAIELKISPLAQESTLLISGRVIPKRQIANMLTRSDHVGYLKITGQKENWDLQVTQLIPVEFDLAVGAAKVTLDMTNLKIEQFGIDSAASTVSIHTPSRGQCQGTIVSRSSTIHLKIPKEAEALVEIDGKENTIYVGERFAGKDGRYETSGYATATDKTNLKIDTILSTVTIN